MEKQSTGIFDSKWVEIFKGDIFIHNGREFYIKYSENQKCLLARLVGDTGQNWRSLEWVANVRKYITVTGQIDSPQESINEIRLI